MENKVEKIYILEIKDIDDGEEIKTFVFDNLQDFNKARLIVNEWGNIENGMLTLSQLLKKYNIKFLDYVYDEIRI